MRFQQLTAPGVAWTPRTVAWVPVAVLSASPGLSLPAGTPVWVVSSQKEWLEVVWRVAAESRQSYIPINCESLGVVHRQLLDLFR